MLEMHGKKKHTIIWDTQLEQNGFIFYVGVEIHSSRTHVNMWKQKHSSSFTEALKKPTTFTAWWGNLLKNKLLASAVLKTNQTQFWSAFFFK